MVRGQRNRRPSWTPVWLKNGLGCLRKVRHERYKLYEQVEHGSATAKGYVLDAGKMFALRDLRNPFDFDDEDNWSNIVIM